MLPYQLFLQGREKRNTYEYRYKAPTKNIAYCMSVISSFAILNSLW